MFELGVTDGNSRPHVCYFALKFICLSQNTYCIHSVHMMYRKLNHAQTPQTAQRNINGPRGICTEEEDSLGKALHGS